MNSAGRGAERNLVQLTSWVVAEYPTLDRWRRPPVNCSFRAGSAAIGASKQGPEPGLSAASKTNNLASLALGRAKRGTPETLMP